MPKTLTFPTLRFAVMDEFGVCSECGAVVAQMRLSEGQKHMHSHWDHTLAAFAEAMNEAAESIIHEAVRRAREDA